MRVSIVFFRSVGVFRTRFLHGSAARARFGEYGPDADSGGTHKLREGKESELLNLPV